MIDANLPPPANEYRVQVATNDKFLFLDMKMSWYPEGDLKISVFRKKGQQLKYSGKGSTHTPGTLREISLGFLYRLAKTTPQKTSLHSEGVEKVYPDHANNLREAGLARPNLPTMGDLWKIQDENMDIENEKEPYINKKKSRNVCFCVSYSRYFSTSIHRVIKSLKKSFNLSWLRVQMSYHRFNNLSELPNRDLDTKIGQGILSKDLMDI